MEIYIIDFSKRREANTTLIVNTGYLGFNVL